MTKATQAPDNEAVEWKQWGGVVERGAPDTLFLTRPNAKRTNARAPGPGAVRRHDLKPWAKEHLTDKNLLLHTDGARACTSRVGARERRALLRRAGCRVS